MSAALVIASALLAFQSSADSGDLQLPLDSTDARWTQARLVDGMRGKAVEFAHPDAKIDVGSVPIDSRQPFTLNVSLRTTDSGFATPLMARDDDAVGFSLVMGRLPGCVSFEAWSWQDVKLVALTRVDDGAWHTITVEYEPQSTVAMLSIDGVVQTGAVLGHGASPRAQLRLGNNIGTRQPFLGAIDELNLVRSVRDPGRFAALAPLLTPAERRADLAQWRERLMPRRTDAVEASSWPITRQCIRTKVADALGLVPQPVKGPLEPLAEGELVGQGVRVQRVSWSTWPGVRATGWLWKPETAPYTKMPAILNLHGHFAGGAIDPVEQVRAARFARAGYVVLSVDTVHVEDIPSGVNAGGIMAWNNIRALDYLISMPTVDESRIGVTGASGGAQQAMYLMALDERIAAAAPVCMASYLAEILMDHSAHCTCNHVPRMGTASDVPAMCSVFAPKPALYISITQDWTHNFPTQGWPEIQSAYRALGSIDSVDALHLNAPHGYDAKMRARAFTFFDGVLAPDHPEALEVDFTPFPTDALQKLGVRGSTPDRAILAAEFLARRARVESLHQLSPALPWKVERSELELIGSAAPPSQWQRCCTRGADGVRIPLVVRRSVADTPEELLLVVAPSQRTKLLLQPPEWLSSAPAAAIMEPRFAGESREFAAAWQRNGLTLGCGEAYLAAHDIAQVIESLPGDARVRVVALGNTSVPALMAAQLAPRMHKLVLEQLGSTYASGGHGQLLAPEILRYGDLPRLVHECKAGHGITIENLAALSQSSAKP